MIPKHCLSCLDRLTNIHYFKKATKKDKLKVLPNKFPLQNEEFF